MKFRNIVSAILLTSTVSAPVFATTGLECLDGICPMPTFDSATFMNAVIEPAKGSVVSVEAPVIASVSVDGDISGGFKSIGRGIGRIGKFAYNHPFLTAGAVVAAVAIAKPALAASALTAATSYAYAAAHSVAGYATGAYSYFFPTVTAASAQVVTQTVAQATPAAVEMTVTQLPTLTPSLTQYLLTGKPAVDPMLAYAHQLTMAGAQAAATKVLPAVAQLAAPAALPTVTAVAAPVVTQVAASTAQCLAEVPAALPELTPQLLQYLLTGN